MTFEAYETSARKGKPTHLFVFTRQSLVWRFAAADRDVTIGGHTYTAAPISRSEIKQTVETPQDSVTITFPYQLDPNTAQPVTQPLGDNWSPWIPSDVVSVACLATQLDDPDHEVITEWLGVVAQPKFTDGQLELTCAPPGAIAKARYQGAKWQRGCWKSVYSTGIRGCNLVAGPIAVAGTVTAVSGNDVTAAAWASPKRTFVGGTAAWTDTNNDAHTANITAASDTTLTLDDVTGITVGTVVTAHTIPIWVQTALTAIDALTLTSADFANSPFNLAGGWLTWTRSNGLVENRIITAHDDSTITILSGGEELAVGTTVSAIPNCEHNWAACTARNNTVNYGGAIYKPVQDPYDGQSMSWS